MSDLVNARHPALVLHRPPRARNQRVSIAELDTPIRLRFAILAEPLPKIARIGPR